jgi:hypothetical protein
MLVLDIQAAHKGRLLSNLVVVFVVFFVVILIHILVLVLVLCLDSSLVGFSGKGNARHTDGQVSGSPLTQQLEGVAFDVAWQ